MFRVPFLVAVALGIAFGGGIWSTLLALEASAGFGAIRVGAWVAFPQAQTVNADPYAKSHRARAGKLLYGGAEGLLFFAERDDAGVPLEGRCSYVVSGSTPTTRLWTLFASGPDGLPLDAGAELPSAVNSRTVLRAPGGSFTIAVSRDAAPGNWLALAPAGRFGLTLTLFDTPAAGSSGITGIDMPKITRSGCSDR